MTPIQPPPTPPVQSPQKRKLEIIKPLEKGQSRDASYLGNEAFCKPNFSSPSQKPICIMLSARFNKGLIPPFPSLPRQAGVPQPLRKRLRKFALTLGRCATACCRSLRNFPHFFSFLTIQRLRLTWHSNYGLLEKL